MAFISSVAFVLQYQSTYWIVNGLNVKDELSLFSLFSPLSHSLNVYNQIIVCNTLHIYTLRVER